MTIDYGRNSGKKKARKKGPIFGQSSINDFAKAGDQVRDRAAKAGLDMSKYGGAGGARGDMRAKNPNNSPNRTDPKGMKIAKQVVMRPKPTQGRDGSSNPGDALDALFSELMGAVAGSGTQIDYESALRDSADAIREAYAADIQAIRTGNKRARKITGRNRREMEAMYGALARTYNREGKNAIRNSENLAQRMSNQADRSGNSLNRQAQEMLRSQADMAKNLGIEEAMPAASEGITKEAGRQTKSIAAEGSRDANRQRAYGGNQQRWMRREGQTARLEGANRSGDLLAGLQDYLFSNQQQINSLKSARGRELASNESAVMGSVAEMQQAADSEMWDRLMDAAGLKLDIDKFRSGERQDTAELQAKLLQQAQGGSNDSQLPGNLAKVQEYLGQTSQPRVAQAIWDKLSGSPEFMFNSVEDPQGDAHKLTPFKAAQMAEQYGRAQGMRPKDIALLRLAAMAGLD